MNPKYKGFYHGHITESNDYREQKKIKTSMEDRLLYKSDDVPEIVSEELWDKVNAIIARRSEKFGNVGYGSVARFPYSGKVTCEEHGTHHYRKVWKDRKIPAESWCCKVYLAKGRVACPTPHLYTKDIDAIMEYIGNDLLSNKEKYIKSVDDLLDMYGRANSDTIDFSNELVKLTNAIKKTKTKQDKLLELYTDDEIDKADYLEKNGRLKEETEQLHLQIAVLKDEQSIAGDAEARLGKVKEFFANLTDNNEGAIKVAQEMLEGIEILKGSTKKEMKIRITMQHGEETEHNI
jgi:uncharacterized protein YjbJ (UPF0337 family)